MNGVLRCVRWLVPDRRDGLVTLALLIGVWLSNVSGTIVGAEELEAEQVARYALQNFEAALAATVPIAIVAHWAAGWSVVGWRRNLGVALAMAAVVLSWAALHTAFRSPNEFSALLGISMSDPAIAFSMAMVWFPLGLLLAAQFHRSALERRATTRLDGLLRERREAQRRFAESRLRAIQSRIGQELLFDALDNVGRLYETEPTRAELLLEELIQYLRRVLPNLGSASSTIGQEVGIAASYVHLRALTDSSMPRFAPVLPGHLLDMRFPPGVLLPLVDGIVGQAHRDHDSIEVRATRVGSCLEVTLAAGTPPPDAALAKARQALQELFADQASLDVVNQEGRATVAVKIWA